MNPSLDVPKSKEEKQSNALAMARLRGLSKFGELLLDCSSTGDYKPVFEFLKNLGPSVINVELRCLDIPISISDISGTGNEEAILLKHFIRAISQQLDTKIDYELCQAYLSLFLKIHSETIMKTPELIQECRDLYVKLSGTWDDLEDTMRKSICVINYLRGAVI